MVRAHAPVLILPTAAAERALGNHFRDAVRAAWRGIAASGVGLEIDHLQFIAAGTRLALCARLRRDGFIEIELGLGDPRLPPGPLARRKSGRSR